MSLKLASLFDGIAGFPLAARRAGIETVWSAEIDSQCRSVSGLHFPDSVQVNNVLAARAMLERKTSGRFATKLVRPDIICGGFPCQDLSVAGRRAGLAGARSGLWFVFRRILGIVRPRWVCIENVPGLLSSNEGRDMRVIADALGKLGYGWAMRIFDAQWCGVPQRRRRVFIVGCLGDGRRAGEVLFESNSLPWDSPPSRSKGQDTAGISGAGTGVCSGAGITHAIQERAVSENLANGPQGKGYQEAIAYTLEARSKVQAVAYQCHGSNVGPMGTLRAGNGNETGGVPFIFEPRIGRNGRGQPSELCPTLKGAEAGETSDMRPCVVTGVPFDDDEKADGDSFARGAQVVQGEQPRTSTPSSRNTRYGVRRLTPLECERLQGFPDEWTRYGHDGREMSDSARYRMLGNAIAVPCVEWFMRRIAASP